MPLHVQCHRLTDINALRVRWQALEPYTDHSFFLSWTWIGSWLAMVPRAPYLIEITNEKGEDIALGCLYAHKTVRHKILPVHQLFLHATGIADFDTITIEYNNLLCRKGAHDEAWSALLSHLQQSPPVKWDEFIVPGCKAALETLLGSQCSNHYRMAEAHTYTVDLNLLRQDDTPPLDTLLASFSKNTRNQIRRSLKLFEEMGPLTVVRAQSTEEGLAMLDNIAIRHKKKWAALDKPSPFDLATFRQFHHDVIATGFANDQIQLLQITAGQHVIGWLYNFHDRGCTLFYLSGFETFTDNRLKPGLVAQCLAIKDNMERNTEIYDFLGGHDRYKRSLGKQVKKSSPWPYSANRCCYSWNITLDNGGRNFNQNLNKKLLPRCPSGNSQQSTTIGD